MTRNGKGILTQLLLDILGDHFFKIPNNAIITHRKVSNIEAERGVLYGARIANFKELEPNERLKTSEMQLLSGGDGIPATPRYKDPMTIRPRFLCILETNHLPEIHPVIQATMERLVVVSFDVTFTNLLPGEEPTKFRRQCDNGLKAKLRAQKAGMLRWLVEGAMEWYATRDLKRQAPPEVKEFTQEYFVQQDIVMQFINESCQLGPELKVGSADLLVAYNDWVGDGEGARRMKAKEFAAEMRSKGYTKKAIRLHPGASPVNGYEGIALRPPQLPPSPIRDKFDL